MMDRRKFLCGLLLGAAGALLVRQAVRDCGAARPAALTYAPPPLPSVCRWHLHLVDAWQPGSICLDCGREIGRPLWLWYSGSHWGATCERCTPPGDASVDVLRQYARRLGVHYSPPSGALEAGWDMDE